MIIKDASVETTIGTERNTFKDKSHHVVTILIQAKNINSEDFEGFRGKMDLEIRRAEPNDITKKAIGELIAELREVVLHDDAIQSELIKRLSSGQLSHPQSNEIIKILKHAMNRSSDRAKL
jgi:hypothetical protein